MEISTFAEQLLFGSTLIDKLIIPTEDFTDENPNVHWQLPDFPARPRELKLVPKIDRQKFPSLHQLEKDDWTRGAIIHFFANHELLAIELMALALLRFPQAEREFRLSLVHTILEEQQHMLLYQQCMNRFGIGFGEIAVNDFFWKCCKDLNDPTQFMLALSLTFEQANLDYCKYYTSAFQQINDTETVKVLQKVYQDEIGHVKNGVKWITQWKPPKQSLWSFFSENLPNPLTPERAKGLVFDKEGRDLSGLDSEFQNELLHFGFSKGKVPDVWCFRPGSEWEVQGSARPQASLNLQHDLGCLPLWFVGPDDLVVCEQQPSQELLNRILEFRNRIPEIGNYATLSNWKHRQAGTLHPWSWTKQVKKEWQNIIQTTPDWQQKRLQSLSIDYSYGLHRQRSIELESSLAQIFDTKDVDLSSVLLFEPGAIKYAKDAVKLNWNKKWVAKKIFSSSGNGIYFFDTLKQFESFQIKPETEILFETQWQRVVDLSFLYDAHPSGTYYNKGITQFKTSSNGMYKGHIVGNYTYGLESNILRLLHTKIHGQNLITIIQNHIRKLLPALWPNYRGPVGVDAMIVNHNGKLLLRPVVEINFRRTMGHYSVALKKIFKPNTNALFEIHSKSHYKQNIQNFNPCTVFDKKLVDGSLVLNDPEQIRHFIAILTVLN